MQIPTEVDYIIVGGGLTGCVISNRVITLNAGKTLGGSSILNYGGWARGDTSDYDAWTRMLDDKRWSYDGLLPYFRRSESFSDVGANSEQYGSNGPMKVRSISGSDPKRKYPLLERIGVERIPSNAGKLAGLSELLENFDDGTEALVHRINFVQVPNQEPRAIGVLLADGRQIKARKEIISAAGAVCSPQLLQLSGVGPASVISRHGIPVIYDSPAVGQNLFDHFALFQVYKLRDPERGLSLGHPSLTDPAFFKGIPVDWIVNEASPADQLKKVLTEDGNPSDSHGLGDAIPVNGNFVATSVMLTLPISRGSLELASASPNEPPIIQPNYFSTAVDRAVLIHGVRRLLQALTFTQAGKDVVESEMGPGPGLASLTLESSDKDIEDQIRAIGSPHYHVAGTCALGTVLDTELRVNGVQGLRVVDASIFPAPLGGHPRASLYAIADLGAEMISMAKESKDTN
ncbi:hypothetical protein BOTCAL_0190g00070 [Botryotinia calthae]|uniref:Glucose-methanol-choline oxidoreductase N-terminal domain-containing protein n=1 Tax=Botryotinia calthae TaxID=38488 RepID=A0A4Y8D244_9HELO|nr:hypothetical protein BOTCAL_0190g00070 [Botryotinia calthae]